MDFETTNLPSPPLDGVLGLLEPISARISNLVMTRAISLNNLDFAAAKKFLNCDHRRVDAAKRTSHRS